MTWRLSKAEQHGVFQRNSLLSVTVELRFHPILKISNGQYVPDFQDRVRDSFPIYSEGKVQTINFQPPDTVETQEEKQFHFKKPDEKTSITLGVSKLILESRHHESHENILNDFNLALSALLEVYGKIKNTRLGMRYINLIERERIQNDLNREVEWRDLIHSSYLEMPASVATLEGTKFYSEINSPIEGGALTLRYGLLNTSEDKKLRFVFDLDRYLDEEFPLQSIMEKLRSFADDIYALFETMIGPELKQWMSKQEVQGIISQNSGLKK